jgi:outer membrane protein assembly factor BamB
MLLSGVLIARTAVSSPVLAFASDTVTFTKHTIDSNFSTPEVGHATDLDGDGDVDILGTSYYGATIAWWENDGSQNFSKHIVDSGFGRARTVYAVDVDGDEDMDVLGASAWDGIAWWENDGSQVFTKHTLNDQVEGDGARCVFATDLDQDGDVDILGTAYFAGFKATYWWENDGNENFSEHTVNDTSTPIYWAYAADVDDDGDIDVLSTGGTNISWWENDGNESFSEHILDDTLDGAAHVAAVDMDDDGDMDVLGAAKNSDVIAWWENDGAEVFTKHVVADALEYAHYTCPADLDGDGDVDIVGAIANASTIAWWENDGVENFTQHTVDDQFSHTLYAEAIDIDKDGDLDILGSAYDINDVAWYENTSSSSGPTDSPWRMYQHDAQRTSRSPFVGPVEPSPKWQYSISPSSSSSPAIAPDGTVYVGGNDGQFHATGPDGAPKWTYAVSSNFIWGSPAIADDGTVYIGHVDYSTGELLALNPDGSLKWSYPARGVRSSPAIAPDGIIYVGASNARLYAINPDGSLKWEYEPGFKESYSSPAIGADGTIYVAGAKDGNIHAVNPDGTTKWTYPIGGDTVSSPTTDDSGTIYIGGADNNLYALNPDGTLKWFYNVGDVHNMRQSTAIGPDGSVYIISYAGYLYALTPAGDLKWTYASGAGETKTTPTVDANGTIYFAASNGQVYAINPDGSEKWTWQSPADRLLSTVALDSDGTLYVSGDGGLYAIGALDGDLPVPTPPPHDDPPPTEPDVPCLNVSSDYMGNFIFAGSAPAWGVCADNTYQAEVDWNGSNSGPGDPGTVTFALNGQAVIEPGNVDGAEHTYNVLSDFENGLNDLTVVAANAQGGSSDPYAATVLKLSFPSWISYLDPDLSSFKTSCAGGIVVYKAGVSFPQPPISFTLDVDPEVPYLGGQVYLDKTYAELAAEAKSTGQGQVGISGQTGFGIKRESGGVTQEAKVGGQLGGLLKGALRYPEGLAITGGEVELDLSGAIAQEEGITILIPALKAAEDWWGVGDVIKWFNKKARVRGELEIEIAGSTGVGIENGQMEWSGGEIEGKILTQLSLILSLVKNLEATFYGGGEPSLTLQFPKDPGYLKEMAIEIFGGVELKIWKFQRTFEASHEWSWPSSMVVAGWGEPSGAGQVYATDSGWQPIPRDYLSNPIPYTHFTANQGGRRLFASDAAQTTQETLIAENIYPYADPALASDGQTLLLWVHDDPGKPQGQGEEIAYTVYDGDAWSAPDSLTDDTLQDFGPTLAYDGQDQAVAVWERMRAVKALTATLDLTYTRDLEIAWSVWGGATWTSPATLTDNEVLDRAPQLSAGADGNLMLLWRRSPNGELVGDAANPETFYTTRWNASAGTWDAPTPVFTAPHVIDISLAYLTGTQAALLYTQDLDGDLGTITDTELYARTWDGVTWSAASRLTDDATPDSHPLALYDGNGRLHLLSLHGDTLHHRMGLTGSLILGLGDTSTALLDYRATVDQAGNLVVLWQDYAGGGVDTFYAIYDGAVGSFSAPLQLTQDQPLEKHLAPTFASDGTLLIAYGKTHLVTETVQVSPTLTISNVTTLGQTDLYALAHQLGRDLVLGDQDIQLSNPNPDSGETVTVTLTLHNDGDLAVPSPTLAVYAGDPGLGGPNLLTTTLPITLSGGMTTSVSFTWTVPMTPSLQRLTALADPADIVSETDETNSEAQQFVVQADLAVAEIVPFVNPGGDLYVAALISNTGYLAADQIPVTFHINAIGDAPLATANIAALSGGGSMDWITVTLPLTGLAAGDHAVGVIVNPDGIITEVTKLNNVAWGTFRHAPDLTLRPQDFTVNETADGLAITVTVRNWGTTPVSGAVARVYEGETIADVNPAVLTMTVPGSIAVDGAMTLNGTWITSDAQPTLYVLLDPDELIAETDEMNNVAFSLGGRAKGKIYLPLILRHD